jgi:hypothetical protein
VEREKAIKSLMDEIVKIVRYSSFVPEYQEKATIEECVGIAISKYFEWDTRIFKAFAEALDDANFHEVARKVDEMLDKWEKASPLPKVRF